MNYICDGLTTLTWAHSNILSFRAKVFKERWAVGWFDYPWAAKTYAGTQHFETWREAYDYARTPMYMINA